MAVEFTDHQRANAKGITCANQFLVAQSNERIGTLDLAQRLNEALHYALLAAARDEMQHDFGIGRRLIDCAIANEFTPQRQTVGEVAIVGNGKTA